MDGDGSSQNRWHVGYSVEELWKDPAPGGSARDQNMLYGVQGDATHLASRISARLV